MQSTNLKHLKVGVVFWAKSPFLVFHAVGWVRKMPGFRKIEQSDEPVDNNKKITNLANKDTIRNIPW